MDRQIMRCVFENSFCFLETTKLLLDLYMWKLKPVTRISFLPNEPKTATRTTRIHKTYDYNKTSLVSKTPSRLLAADELSFLKKSTVVTEENKNYVTKFPTSFPIATCPSENADKWGKKKLFKHSQHHFTAQHLFPNIQNSHSSFLSNLHFF